MSPRSSGASGNPLWLGAACLAVLIFPLSAWAACLDPNPNVNGPPFVDGCPVPASSLNNITLRGMGNFAPDASAYGYAGTLTPYLGMTLGNAGVPNTTVDAVALFQKLGTNHDNAHINGVLWADLEPPSGALIGAGGVDHGTGIVGQVNVKGTWNGSLPSPFFEGVRGNCNLLAGSANIQCSGSVSEVNVNVPDWVRAIGHEGAINLNNGVGSPRTFSDSRWDAAFLSSCGDHGVVAGGAKCGTGFMVNPDNAYPTHWGFYVPRRSGRGGIDVASFESDDTTGQFGLDLGKGGFSSAAIRVPNGGGLSSIDHAGSANIEVVGTDSADNVVVGHAKNVTSVVLGDPAGAVPTRVTGSASFGTNSMLRLARGEIGMAVISPSAGAPGAGAVKFAAVCGTTVGTAKIIVYAGTSTTPVTLLDNIGSGVSGC